ncbi:MAG: hypothetical protein R2827_06385 [Bdellovibrionales bacterium]
MNTLIFVAVMIVSWNYINQPSTIPESTHMSIQADLRNIIESTINQQAPNASRLQFHRFWTENVDSNTVKAYFKYSYDDVTGENLDVTNTVTLDGFAIVNRAEDSSKNVEYWNFEELYLLNDQVEYTEPLRISSSPDGN